MTFFTYFGPTNEPFHHNRKKYELRSHYGQFVPPMGLKNVSNKSYRAVIWTQYKSTTICGKQLLLLVFNFPDCLTSYKILERNSLSFLSYVDNHLFQV